MADETEQGDQSAATTTEEAKEVVDSWLGLTGEDGFITRHLDHILNKLEEAHDVASRSRRNPDMVFFAESFPTIDGLVQVGTTRDEYRRAIEKVIEQERAEGAPPPASREEEAKEREQAEHVISALVFHYVARLGAIRAGVDAVKAEERPGKGLLPEKERDREVWGPIWQRVLKLTSSE